MGENMARIALPEESKVLFEGSGSGPGGAAKKAAKRGRKAAAKRGRKAAKKVTTRKKKKKVVRRKKKA